jgi:hypothetical protein
MSVRRPDGTDGSEPPADDLPRWLLSVAAACAPAGRADWGRAMLTELDQVTGLRARWRFALGAARAALVPPPRSRPAAITLAAAAAATAAACHVLVPQAGVVGAVAVPGIPALFAWAALSRPHPAGQAGLAGRAVQVIAAVVIIACPALAMRILVLYPVGDSPNEPVVSGVMTVVFAAELGAYLLLVLRRPGLLGAGRHSGLLAVAAVLTAGWVSVAYPQPGSQSGFPVLAPAYLALLTGALLAVGVLAALPGLLLRHGIGRSLRRGAAEVLWGLLLSGPAAFIEALLTTSRSAVAVQAADPATITYARQQGSTNILGWVAHDDLGGSLMLLTFLTFFIMLVIAGTLADGKDLSPAGPQASRGEQLG